MLRERIKIRKGRGIAWGERAPTLSMRLEWLHEKRGDANATYGIRACFLRFLAFWTETRPQPQRPVIKTSGNKVDARGTIVDEEVESV